MKIILKKLLKLGITVRDRKNNITNEYLILSKYPIKIHRISESKN